MQDLAGIMVAWQLVAGNGVRKVGNEELIE